ncbi:MAG: hypothetical protein U5K69_23760 [Balneolaceae bacterium]|nr:hypothetical protein [Balneolaceae bacterium]
MEPPGRQSPALITCFNGVGDGVGAINLAGFAEKDTRKKVAYGCNYECLQQGKAQDMIRIFSSG